MAIIRLGCPVLTPLSVRWRLPNAIVIHPELLSVFGSNGLPVSTSALRIWNIPINGGWYNHLNLMDCSMILLTCSGLIANVMLARASFGAIRPCGPILKNSGDAQDVISSSTLHSPSMILFVTSAAVGSWSIVTLLILTSIVCDSSIMAPVVTPPSSVSSNLAAAYLFVYCVYTVARSAAVASPRCGNFVRRHFSNSSIRTARSCGHTTSSCTFFIFGRL